MSADQFAQQTKTCVSCGKTLTLDFFSRDKNKPLSRRNDCKACQKIKHAEYYQKNRAAVLAKTAEYIERNVVKYMLANARRRAEASGLEFALTESDIYIPKYCPALGIELVRRKFVRGPRDSSPSLDRIDSSKGYVRGNVVVISMLANAIKRNATSGQIHSVARWYTQVEGEQRMNPRELIKSLNVPVVGITGRKYSGKSTFAKSLGESFDWHVRLAFADPIRATSLAIFGSAYESHEEKDAHDAYWSEKLGDGWATGRQVLQRLGTDIGRKLIHENVWLWSMERRLLALVDRIKDPGHPKPVITIEDCRFKNECEMVREMGGTIVRMVNKNLPPNTDAHESEAGVPDDYVDHTYEVETAEDVARIAKAFAFCMLQGKSNANVGK